MASMTCHFIQVLQEGHAGEEGWKEWADKIAVISWFRASLSSSMLNTL
jgi:hypothetical protein